MFLGYSIIFHHSYTYPKLEFMQKEFRIVIPRNAWIFLLDNSQLPHIHMVKFHKGPGNSRVLIHIGISEI
jgi:hypothetical protein